MYLNKKIMYFIFFYLLLYFSIRLKRNVKKHKFKLNKF